MQFGRFRLGMRTIKSALAVMICILVFHISNRGTPLIAALSAVFSLRQDLTTSVSFGKSRVLGNSLGGVLALFYFFVQSYFQNEFLVQVILLPILVVVIIVFSDGIDNNAGIVSGIATMLMIALSIPSGESFSYAFARVMDTFIGTTIAISINALRPHANEREKQIAEDLVVLKKKEAKLQAMLSDVQEKIKDHD